MIDTGKLRLLTAVRSEPPPGHVSLTLVPTDPNLLDEWAAVSGTGQVHPLTQDILAAIVDTVKRPKV